MPKWLVEFEETPLVDFFGQSPNSGAGEDVIESPEEMKLYLQAWIDDDPQRAKWLKVTQCVRMEP